MQPRERRPHFGITTHRIMQRSSTGPALEVAGSHSTVAISLIEPRRIIRSCGSQKRTRFCGTDSISCVYHWRLGHHRPVYDSLPPKQLKAERTGQIDDRVSAFRYPDGCSPCPIRAVSLNDGSSLFRARLHQLFVRYKRNKCRLYTRRK
jgi:hypothetical protein